MSDRTVSVRLGLDAASYTNAISKARQDTLAFTRDVSQEMRQAARSSKAEMTQLGTAALALGAAGALGLGKITQAAAAFDKEMSAVAAVAGASAQEMGKLRQAAIDAGAATVFSARESAMAITELSKAGVVTADILGGALSGALNLAAAGGLDLADAATIAAQAMNIFDLAGSDTAHIADVLAAGANKSAADVSTLGDALRQGGLMAAQTGLSLEETVGALSLFADNALVGSDAGTSLKTMLQTLTPSSDEAAQLMEDLGFSAFDAAGEFIGLEGVAGELQAAFGGLTTEQRNAAMSTIFGSDAIRAANVLMQAGAGGVDEYTRAVNDQGAAARMAATMLDNLAGDVEEFGGSVETAMIEFGEEADGALRKVVQFGTSTVNALADMPDEMQAVTMGLGGIVSAVGVAAGGFLLAAPRIADTKDAFEKLTTSMPRTIAGFRAVGSFLTGPWGLAVSGAVLGLGLLWNEQRQANDRLRAATDLLDENTGALLRNAAQTRAVQLQQSGLAEDAERFGVSLATLTSASMGNVQAQDLMRDAIDRTVAGLQAEYDALTEASDPILVEQLASGIERTANAGNALLASTVQQADALADQTAATVAAAQAAHDLRTTALGLGIAFEDLRNDQYQLLGATDGWAASALAANDAALTTTDTLRGLGLAYGQSREAIDEQLESFAGYADNMGAYNRMLSDLNAANRDHAEQTAAATADAEDSWEDYFTEVPVSAEVYLQSLRDQVTAQQEWADLIAEAQRQGLDSIAAEIMAAGPEHNDLYQDLLIDGPLERAIEAEGLLEDQVRQNVIGMAQTLDSHGLDFIDAMGNMGGDAVAAIAEQLGMAPAEVAGILDTADVVARERGRLLQATFDQIGGDSTAALALRLREGVYEAAGIAVDYSNALAAGINPILPTKEHTP